MTDVVEVATEEIEFEEDQPLPRPEASQDTDGDVGSQLMVDTAARIQEIFGATVIVAGTMACRASREIGALLLGAKKRIPHGEFEPWLKEHILPIGPWAHSTVKKFMNVAKKPDFELFNGEPSAMYVLAKSDTPPEALDEALRLSTDGEFVSHARAQKLVADCRYAADPDDSTVENEAADVGGADASREQVTTPNSSVQDLPSPSPTEADTAPDTGLPTDAETLLGKLDSPSPRRITSIDMLTVVELIKAGEPIGLLHEGLWPCLSVPDGLRGFKAKIPEELTETKALIEDQIEQLQVALAGLADAGRSLP